MKVTINTISKYSITLVHIYIICFVFHSLVLDLNSIYNLFAVVYLELSKFMRKKHILIILPCINNNYYFFKRRNKKSPSKELLNLDSCDLDKI